MSSHLVFQKLPHHHYFKPHELSAGTRVMIVFRLEVVHAVQKEGAVVWQGRVGETGGTGSKTLPHF